MSAERGWNNAEKDGNPSDFKNRNRTFFSSVSSSNSAWADLSLGKYENWEALIFIKCNDNKYDNLFWIYFDISIDFDWIKQYTSNEKNKFNESE